MFNDLSCHQRICAVVAIIRIAAVGGVDLFLTAARVVYAEVVSYEVAFGHAVGAHDTETAELIRHIEVGMESKRRPAFILTQGGLVVDNIGVAVEDRIGA